MWTPKLDAEQTRLARLREYDLLDTPPEPQFSDLAVLASQTCATPIAMISLLDADRLWFKAAIGVDVQEVPRDRSFCRYACTGTAGLMVVPDARQDERFRDNPYVTSAPNLRFYAGMPLKTHDGQVMGTLCVFDTVPRTLTPQQADGLQALARQVVSQMDLRRTAAENARLCNEARQSARRARHDATHDELTGLPNRTLFAEKVAECIEKARADSSRRYAVLFMDLDRFKIVNDSLGHAAGDLLLHTVARRLSVTLAGLADVADSHAVARFGGDEFVVLFDDVSDPDVVENAVQKMLAAIARPFHFGGTVLHAAASVGIVVGPGDYLLSEDLLRDADAALHQAKAVGRGQYVVFDAGMHAQALRRLQIEADLRRAVERDELLLHYQPVVSLATHQPVGVEALVRWRHEGKLVSPADFIPIAEETGLIVPIGRWVLAEAVRQAAAWRSEFFHLPPFKMAVNVSRRQLADPDLVPLVKSLLKGYSIDPATLMLEITESVIMNDADDARRVLSELRGLGVRLAMDDFGTGYSSLSCLHDLDLDVLKIDRSFVINLGHRRDAAVLRAVMDLAHGLGMSVVAEGIETPAQMAFLRATACDYGQGYLFSRPLSASAAGAFLTRGATMAEAV